MTDRQLALSKRFPEFVIETDEPCPRRCILESILWRMCLEVECILTKADRPLSTFTMTIGVDNGTWWLECYVLGEENELDRVVRGINRVVKSARKQATRYGISAGRK